MKKALTKKECRMNLINLAKTFQRLGFELTFSHGFTVDMYTSNFGCHDFSGREGLRK